MTRAVTCSLVGRARYIPRDVTAGSGTLPRCDAGARRDLIRSAYARLISIMTRRLIPLFACVLIVMVGFGIALPVMPLYAERLALASGGSPQRAALHIGMITAAYPLTQLVFAPLWGKLSDRIGRRPLVVVGITGFAITQALFGLASGLPLLYGARIAGGGLSAALIPAASAYVADVTGADERGAGIASLNTAVGIGTVVGPALGALLVRRDLHVRVFGEHVRFDGFSVPFFAAAAFACIALIAALVTLRESRIPDRATDAATAAGRGSSAAHPLLAAVLASYVGISIFEATFALFAVARYDLGTRGVAAAFTECGLVMIVAQLAAPRIARSIGERRVVALGLAAMSAGLIALVAARTDRVVYAAVLPLGAGMALAGPTLTSLLSKHESRRVGAVLGLQQAVQGLGQVVGALSGMLLFGWSAPAPYVAAAALLTAVAVAIVTREAASQRT